MPAPFTLVLVLAVLTALLTAGPPPVAGTALVTSALVVRLLTRHALHRPARHPRTGRPGSVSTSSPVG